MTEPTIAEVVPARVAFIIDGVVQDVLNTDDRLAAIFLSQPKVVDVTDNAEFITSGYTYNEELNTFTSPNPVIEEFAVPAEGVAVGASTEPSDD